MKKILLYIFSGPILLHAFVPNVPQISFKENLGQVSDQYYKPRPDVLFSGTDGNMNFHLKNSGISYQLYKIEKTDSNPTKLRTALFKKNLPAENVSIYRIDIKWLNANNNVTVEKGQALPDHDNYYSEVCPNGITNVKSYKELMYKNIYSGISLHYYSKDERLKYDYIIAPYADYKQIQLQINGAENISLNEKGELIIKTPFGDITEQAPLVLQNGKQLTAKWIVTNNVVSFDIRNIDPKLQLIVDPLVRVWGTYYGGAGSLGNTGSGVCKTDVNGNVFMVGSTDCNIGTTIATIGSFQSNFIGATDGFLVKFNTGGVRLWATYYGGAGGTNFNECSIDPSGNVCVAGLTSTSSGSVIATPGSHQSFYGGGAGDGVLVKFNSNGIRQWGTYYGDIGIDNAISCATDVSGNIYLSGWTDASTTTLIATPGSHQPIYGGGDDAFLAKFNSSGVRQWATYYGGNSSEAGYCSTDKNGNVYLTGFTGSTSNIASIAAHQTTYGGTYLAKFNGNGLRLWSTYYGGSGSDGGYSCKADSVGNIYLCGKTTCSISTIISTTLSHQTTFGGGTIEGDGFLVKFDPNGVRKWGTYYGGTGDDYCNSLSIDRNGNIFIAGQTESSGALAISTSGSYQSAYGGNTNVFLVKFDSVGFRQWGTYYGSNNGEFYGHCDVDLNGNIYLGGSTSTPTGTIIATIGSHQPNFSGNVDAFLVKFFDCSSSNGPACVGIEEFKNPTLSLNVYPNPNNGDFIIETETELSLRIVNELGQVVQQLNLSATNNYKTHLNNLNAGVYFITSDKGRVNKKIVVIK